MRKNILSVIIIFVYFNLPIIAQVGLSYELNRTRIGDKLSKKQISTVSPGNSGEDVLWNFDEVHEIKNYPIEIHCDSDSTILYELSQEKINRLSQEETQQLLLGIESPLVRIDYTEPVKLMEYPFYYGDTFTNLFSGVGTYCKTHVIETSGESNSEADATGTLILIGDTIDNVIRIHSIRSGAVFMHLENDNTDEARAMIKQEIEESYRWYARGFRYPLLETISTSYYNDMDLVSCIQKAYCYTPELQRMLPDEKNDSIQRIDSISAAPIADIFHYRAETIGNQVKLTYSLDEDASITILVCNHRGMAYKRKSYYMSAGNENIEYLDISNLPTDTYILYINVNGKIYSEKLILN